MKKFLFFLFVTAGMSACEKDNFPKYTLLNDLRVVALQTTTPEVNPGTSVTITPYLSDVNNTGPLTYTATGCVDPGVSYGADPTCEGNSTAVSLASGTVTTLSAGNTYTASADSFSATVPATILQSQSAVRSYNGVSYLITYTISNSQGRTVKAFRRIVVTESSKSTKNSNPSLSDILANGSTLGALSAGSVVSLTADFSASSAETFSYKKTDGSLSSAVESLETTWFISDGEMKYERTLGSEASTYTAPAEYPSTRGSFILAVTRDGRGGLDVRKVTIH